MGAKLLALALGASFAGSGEADSRTRTTVPSVGQILQALHARSDVTFRVERGWTVAMVEPAHDREGSTIWSFVPPSHPAYPSMIRRKGAMQGARFVVAMTVQCEASPTACAALKATAEVENRKLMEGSFMSDLH